MWKTPWGSGQWGFLPRLKGPRPAPWNPGRPGVRRTPPPVHRRSSGPDTTGGPDRRSSGPERIHSRRRETAAPGVGHPAEPPTQDTGCDDTKRPRAVSGRPGASEKPLPGGSPAPREASGVRRPLNPAARPSASRSSSDVPRRPHPVRPGPARMPRQQRRCRPGPDGSGPAPPQHLAVES